MGIYERADLSIEDIPIDADNAVACQMKQLRKKLRNNPKGAPYIETV